MDLLGAGSWLLSLLRPTRQLVSECFAHVHIELLNLRLRGWWVLGGSRHFVQKGPYFDSQKGMIEFGCWESTWGFPSKGNQGWFIGVIPTLSSEDSKDIQRLVGKAP